jgi:hypothetical protein
VCVYRVFSHYADTNSLYTVITRFSSTNYY